MEPAYKNSCYKEHIFLVPVSSLLGNLQSYMWLLSALSQFPVARAGAGGPGDLSGVPAAHHSHHGRHRQLLPLVILPVYTEWPCCGWKYILSTWWNSDDRIKDLTVKTVYILCCALNSRKCKEMHWLCCMRTHCNVTERHCTHCRESVDIIGLWRKTIDYIENKSRKV